MTDRRLVQRDEPDDTARPPAGKAPARSASNRRNGARRPDIGALEGHLGYFMRRAQLFIFQDFIRTLSSIDIRPAQYSVLIVVGANPGLSQADVSEALGIERARLARLLHRLERRGLVQRLSHPVDRRSHSLKLTAKGRNVLKRAKALAAIHEERLLQRLGAAPYRLMMEALFGFHL